MTDPLASHLDVLIAEHGADDPAHARRALADLSGRYRPAQQIPGTVVRAAVDRTRGQADPEPAPARPDPARTALVALLAMLARTRPALEAAAPTERDARRLLVELDALPDDVEGLLDQLDDTGLPECSPTMVHHMGWLMDTPRVPTPPMDLHGCPPNCRRRLAREHRCLNCGADPGAHHAFCEAPVFHPARPAHDSDAVVMHTARPGGLRYDGTPPPQVLVDAAREKLQDALPRPGVVQAPLRPCTCGAAPGQGHTLTCERWG